MIPSSIRSFLFSSPCCSGAACGCATHACAARLPPPKRKSIGAADGRLFREANVHLSCRARSRTLDDVLRLARLSLSSTLYRLRFGVPDCESAGLRDSARAAVLQYGRWFPVGGGCFFLQFPRG